MSHTLFQLLRDTPKIDGAMPALVSKLPSNPVTLTFNLRSISAVISMCILPLTYHSLQLVLKVHMQTFVKYLRASALSGQ